MGLMGLHTKVQWNRFAKRWDSMLGVFRLDLLYLACIGTAKTLETRWRCMKVSVVYMMNELYR